jgi:hypothetical protein
MRSPMFSNLGSALRNANAESALYRRWFPGAGQMGGGFAGMGFCDPSDPTCVDTTTLDVSGGYTGAPTGIVTSTDPLTGEPPTSSMFDQLVAQGVNRSDACVYDPAGCDAANALIGMGPTPNTTPGAPLTDAQLQQQQTAAAAALLKMVPTAAATAAALANGLSLTPAQIAAGVQAGTVRSVPSTTCPSGYQYMTGACVPGSGQWFSFATNTQVMLYGAVILGALIIVPALSGGGGRRRR